MSRQKTQTSRHKHSCSCRRPEAAVSRPGGFGCQLVLHLVKNGFTRVFDVKRKNTTTSGRQSDEFKGFHKFLLFCAEFFFHIYFLEEKKMTTVLWRKWGSKNAEQRRCCCKKTRGWVHFLQVTQRLFLSSGRWGGSAVYWLAGLAVAAVY